MALVVINVLSGAADFIDHDSVVNNHVVIITAKYYGFVNKNPVLGTGELYIHWLNERLFMIIGTCKLAHINKKNRYLNLITIIEGTVPKNN